ncbi:TetR family transcriptional regulator [Frankia sp. CcI49]|uniref:TetR/AcrR family transcriptional regulator n=1 Tax=Frankia sp. CcI49 TaxID=1745382 RepID=UPI000976F5C8|nr:TetR/AcrR family transcriptional regulator [Frankia sp. CcI49]ONH54832.1 TetR family transcriptional regulator [Frankia sp. CcI49]
MPYRRPAVVDDRLAAARERLVAAATDLVAEAGWAGASVTAVAAAAGMSVGSVYQHFPSKSELVCEVFRRAAAQEVELIRAVAGEPSPARGVGLAAAAGDPVDRLVLAVALFTRRVLARRGLVHALLVAPSDSALEAQRRDFRRRYRDVFAALIRAGVEAGMLPTQDPVVAAAALTGAIGEVLAGPVPMAHDLPRDGREAEPVVREVVEMALRCVGARPMVRGWSVAEGIG